MAEDVKQEMNATPGCIPSKWTRNTVADGDWLQKYTIAPLSSRDNFLADKISGAEFNIDEEIEARKAGDAYLSANLTGFSAEYFEFKDNVETSAENLSAALQAEIDRATDAERQEADDRANADIALNLRIDKLEAATDVVMVFSTYDEFSSTSGDVLSGLTDRDVIKVLRDEHYVPEGDPDESSEDDDYFQVYYQWHDNTHSATLPDWKGWSAIGSLDPYYSISEIDTISAGIYQTIEDVSATVSSNYLSANTTAVQPGHNIQISAHPTNPYILIETKDNVDFDRVSATTFSGINLYGSTKNTTIDGLIGSAESGQDAWNKVNSAYWSASNFEGTNTASGRLSGSFELSAGENIDLSIVGNRINIDVLPGTHTYEVEDTDETHYYLWNTDSNVAYNFLCGPNGDWGVLKSIIDDVEHNIPVFLKETLNTNNVKIWRLANYITYINEHDKNVIEFTFEYESNEENYYGIMNLVGGDIVHGTSWVVSVKEGVTNSYSATIAYQAQNLGNVGSADVISSAQNGKDAYDKVSTAYWSAYKDSTHSGSGKLSANFSISAGENLDMEISDNIIKLNGKPAGVIHDDNLSGLGVQGDLLGLNSAINIYVPYIANQNRNSAIVEVGNTPVPYNMGTYNEGFAVYRKHNFNVSEGSKTAYLGTTVNFTGMSVTHTADGIGDFNQCSKYGEVFDLNYNCGDHYVKHLWVNDDGLNFTDNGNLSYSANLNFVNLKFYDNQNNIPGTNTKYESQYVNAASIYKWNNTSNIVTQSATLSAGFGIQFTSAATTAMGIKLDATINADDKIAAIGGIELAGGGISSIRVDSTVFTGRDVIFSAGSNIYFTTANNKIGINLNDNISLGDTNSQIELRTETEEEEACIIINDNNMPLQLYNNYISRNGSHTTWDKVINASNQIPIVVGSTGTDLNTLYIY